jgi:hypothetical protein
VISTLSCIKYEKEVRERSARKKCEKEVRERSARKKCEKEVRERSARKKCEKRAGQKFYIQQLLLYAALFPSHQL